MSVLLARLAVHYYRPDFTEAQAKSLIVDMIEDLAEFSVHEVEQAIKTYRQTPPPAGKGKYFPDSSALRQIILESRSERGTSTLRPGREEFGESRPLMWWWKSQWKPHWRESEIPSDYRQAYFARKAKMGKAQ